VKEILQQTRIYLMLFVLYIVIAGSALLVNNKGEIEIWLNGFHTIYLDHFFYWATYLGDGFFAFAFLTLYILFIHISRGIIITVILLLVSGVTQILKHIVFPVSPRPSVFLKDVPGLHYVPGLEIHTSNSFPSGHTTQAFCIFFLLSVFTMNKRWQYLFFTLALLAGISRVYLLQHFVIDTYFGAIIGTLGSFLLIAFFDKSNFLSTDALNKPLISLR